MKYVFILVAMLALACRLPSGAALYATPASTISPTRAIIPTVTQPQPTSPAAVQACKVATGLHDGWLHVRSCAGVACPAVAWLAEGASVLPTGQRSGAWVAIGGGWVNGDFLECGP